MRDISLIHLYNRKLMFEFYDVALCIQKSVLDAGGRIAFLSTISVESHADHDIDVVLDPIGWRAIPRVFKALEKNFGLLPSQFIQYDVGRSVYCLLSRLMGTQIQTLKLDFLCDQHANNEYAIDTSELLSDVVHEGLLSRPCAARELGYLLSKRLEKGLLDYEQFSRMRDLLAKAAKDIRVISHVTRRMVPDSVVAHFLGKLVDEDYTGFNLNLRSFGLICKIYRWLVRPWSFPIYLLLQIRRIYARITNPVGLLIDNAGPGSTYTSLRDFLMGELAVLFRGRILCLRVRPIALGWIEVWIQLRRGFLVTLPAQYGPRNSGYLSRDDIDPARAVAMRVMDALFERAPKTMRLWWQ